jgi:cell division protein FtsB
MKRLFHHRAALYVAALVALLAASAADPEGLRKALHHEREAERLAAENASLEQNVVRLRREVKALSGDPAALERAAREELGYVKPGEIVYQLDEGGEAR